MFLEETSNSLAYPVHSITPSHKPWPIVQGLASTYQKGWWSHCSARHIQGPRREGCPGSWLKLGHPHGMHHLWESKWEALVCLTMNAWRCVVSTYQHVGYAVASYYVFSYGDYDLTSFVTLSNGRCLSPWYLLLFLYVYQAGSTMPHIIVLKVHVFIFIFIFLWHFKFTVHQVLALELFWDYSNTPTQQTYSWFVHKLL